MICKDVGQFCLPLIVTRGYRVFSIHVLVAPRTEHPWGQWNIPSVYPERRAWLDVW